MSTDTGRFPAATWRPTRTATTTSAALAAAGTLVLAAVAGGIAPAAIALLSGLCLAGTVWTTAVAERRVATLLGGVLAAAAGVGLFAGVVVAVTMQVSWPPTPPIPFLEFAPFVVFAAGLFAGFGTLAMVWGVSPSEHAGTAGYRLFVISLVPAAALFVVHLDLPTEPFLELLAAAGDLVFARGGPFSIGEAAAHLGWLLFLTTGALVAVMLALGRLPLAELAREERQAVVEAAVTSLRRWLGIVAGICGSVAVFPVVLRDEFIAAFAEAPPWLLPALVTVSTSSVLRWVLAAVFVVGLVATAVPMLARVVASERFRPDSLPGASLLAGGALVALVIPLHRPLESVAIESASTDAGRELLTGLFETFGSVAVSLGIVVLGVLLATLLLLAVRLLGALRILGGTPGVQFASVGVFTATIGAALADAHVAVVVCGVAMSLLVWDFGEFAATLGGEVGRHGDSRRSELVHVVGGTLIAGLAAVTAIGAVSVLGLIPEAPTHPVVVMAAAAVGTLLLIIVAR